MARSAVLSGRTLADLVRDLLVVALMLLVGFLVGFRIHTNVAAMFAGTSAAVLRVRTRLGVRGLVGLFAPNAETA